LQRRTFPPLQYAVDGLISKGLTILAGSPKVTSAAGTTREIL
jgi:hypothetical protein